MGDTTKARAAALEQVPCKHCGGLFAVANVGKHERACLSNPVASSERGKECPVCGTLYYGRGRTCSRACANKSRWQPRDGVV